MLLHPARGDGMVRNPPGDGIKEGGSSSGRSHWNVLPSPRRVVERRLAQSNMERAHADVRVRSMAFVRFRSMVQGRQNFGCICSF